MHVEQRRIYQQTYHAAHKEKLNQRSREYYKANAERLRAHQAVYRVANLEHVKALQRRTREKHKEKNLQRARLYHQTHKDRLRARYRERYLTLSPEAKIRRRVMARTWEKRARIANPATFRLAGRIKQARRRARQRAVADCWTAQDTAFAIEYWERTCAVCGREEGFWYTIALDHWIPISSQNCPGTVPGNMVPLCHGKKGIPVDIARPCNNDKGNTQPWEWLMRKLGKQRAARQRKAITSFFSAHRARSVGENALA
jgi:hypothetical protein